MHETVGFWVNAWSMHQKSRNNEEFSASLDISNLWKASIQFLNLVVFQNSDRNTSRKAFYYWISVFEVFYNQEQSFFESSCPKCINFTVFYCEILGMIISIQIIPFWDANPVNIQWAHLFQISSISDLKWPHWDEDL